MKVTNKNKDDIKSINIHDFGMTSLNYNNFTRNISIDFISNKNNLPSLNILFNNVIYWKFQNANFWTESNRIDVYGIWYDENHKNLNELICEFKSKNNDQNYFPEILKEDLIEIR